MMARTKILCLCAMCGPRTQVSLEVQSNVYGVKPRVKPGVNLVNP